MAASPGGGSIDKVSVKVVPDTSTFADDLKADLARVSKDTKVTINVGANFDGEQLKAAAETAARDTNPEVTVTPKFDGTELKAEAEAAAQTAKPQVTYKSNVDTADLKLKADAAAKLASPTIKAKVTEDKTTARDAGSAAASDFGGSFINSLAKFKVSLVGALATVGTSAAPFLSGLIVQLVQTAGGLAALAPAAIVAGAAIGGTLLVGLHGVSAAVAAIGTKQFGADLKGLAPAAQDFVKAIAAAKPAFKDLQLSVQGALFQGLGDDIRGAALTDLPTFSTGMTQVGKGINLVVQDLLNYIGTQSSLAAFKSIFADTGVAVGLLHTGAVNVESTFLSLAQTGASFLPSLAVGFDNVTSKFTAFIQRVTVSGQLRTFIQNAIIDTKQLFTIIGNLGTGLFGFFQVFAISGGSALGTLVSISGAFKAWVQTPGGTDFLKTLSTGLQGIGKDFGPAVAAAFTTVASVVQTLLPYISKFSAEVGPSLAGDIKALKGPLDDFASGIGKFATGPFAHTVLPLLTTLVNILNQLDQNLPAVVQLSGAFIAVWSVAKFTGVIGVLGKLSSAIKGVSAASGAAAAASGGAGAAEAAGAGATVAASSFVVPLIAIWGVAGIAAANAFVDQFSGKAQARFNKELGVDAAQAKVAAAQAFVDAGSGLGAHLEQGYLGALGFMVPNTQSILSSVGGVIDTVGPGLWGQFGAAGAKAVLSWDTGLNTLPAETNAVIKNAGSVIASDTSVPNAAIGLANNAKDLFTGGLATLPPLTAGIVGQMGQAIVIGAPSIWAAAAAAGAGTSSSFVTQFAPAPAQARSIAQQIVSAVQGGLSPMAAIGAAAGANLVGGLQGQLQAGVGIAGKIASQITSALQANKGPISKDKTLWKPAGLAIVASLFDVLTPAIGTATTTAQRLTQALVVTPPNTRSGLAFTAPGGSAGSAAGATVNVYPQPGQSEEAIGMSAARQLGFRLLVGA